MFYPYTFWIFPLFKKYYAYYESEFECPTINSSFIFIHTKEGAEKEGAEILKKEQKFFFFKNNRLHYWP